MRERGYGWSACQNPACVHLCATLLHVPHVDEIITSMREVAAELLAEANAPGAVADNATAGIYGVQDDSAAVSGRDPREGMRRYQAKVLDMPRPKAAKAAAMSKGASKL